MLAAICFTGVTYASVIQLDSRAGLTTSMSGVFTVATAAHPVWQASHPINPGDPTDTSAVWISYADTGYGGTYFQPYMGTTPAFSVFDSFTSGTGILNLNVWADDSADVLLDGIYLTHAFFTQNTCSGQPIGCTPKDVGSFHANLTSGNHTLEFVVYQTGTGDNTTNNPLGLLYTGTAPAPEPASCFLAGAALIAVGLVKRRRSGTKSTNSEVR